METFTATPYANSESLLLGSSAISRFMLERDQMVHSSSRTERQEVQSRRRQIANEWSKQERAARLRVGLARRAWLLNSIQRVTTR